MMRHLLSAAVLLGITACGADEATASHTPADIALFVAGAQVTALDLTAGQTTQVEVRFLADDGDVIEGIEDEHYAAFAFAPPGLATTAYATGRHFVVDVTAQGTAGAGTVMVGYGHGPDADELFFGPFAVTVQ